MALKIKLLGWSVEGLRCPDHVIRLTSNERTTHKVSLIQMPNGTGKTTILNIIRAVLSGELVHWDSDKILSYRRPNETATKGHFTIQLQYGERLLTFETAFDFENATISFRTSHGSGAQDGFRPPPELLRFLRPDFVGLFIFDGELASNLLDEQHTKARDAIDALFQLNLIQDIANAFNRNWDQHTQKVSSTEVKGLNRRRGRYNKLKKRLGELRNEREGLGKKQKLLHAQQYKIENEYESFLRKDSSIGKQIENLSTQLNEAESEIKSSKKELIDGLINPQALCLTFTQGIVELKASLDKLKLPASTSREFFEELAQADICVCGRLMDDNARSKVRERAASYLGDDDVGVLNSVKTDIATYCSEPPQKYTEELDRIVQKLSENIRKRDEIATNKKALVEQKISEGDKELEHKANRLKEIQNELNEIESRIIDLDAPANASDGDDSSSIKSIEKLLKKAEEDVAEATNTIELKEKTNVIVRVLWQATELARNALTKKLVDETNLRIQSLMPRDSVRLSGIDQSLQLQGQRGASVGQTLAVSYAFLATLFNRAEHSLPFVVDSPAGSLDLNVRPQVAKLIPLLCDQFVAFTISSERDKFVPQLSSASGGDVQYITLFRKSANTQKLLETAKGFKYSEYSNSILVTGDDFFNQFDLEEEEN